MHACMHVATHVSAVKASGAHVTYPKCMQTYCACHRMARDDDMTCIILSPCRFTF